MWTFPFNGDFPCGEEKKAEMDFFLTTGIILGLSSGFSPGPLTTLVISQALQHGVREGLKVALAPFITDLPIVLLSVFAMTRLRDFHSILGAISIVGALFLIYLAYLSFKTSKIGVDIKAGAPRSLGKGTLANFLNPAPYLFWITIGAPNVVAAWTQSPLIAAGFLAGFYTCLVGAKMFLAVVAANSRRFLSGPAYGYVMRILGGLLLILAFVFLRDGIRLWG
jgi:threonine/homoserine/homoserine lactone efflux protein